MKGNLALLLTAAVWGTGFVAQRLGNEILPPMTFNAIRQLAASLVLCPLLIPYFRSGGYLSKDSGSARELAQRKKTLLKAGLICGVLLMTASMLQQIGLVTVSAGKSGFITSIYIVFVPVFGALLGVKTGKKSIVCIIVAMTGFAVMSLRGGLDTITAGDWITLASAAGFAAQIVAVNHFVDEGNAIALSVIQMFVCGVTGIVLALTMEQSGAEAVRDCVPILLYATFIPTAVGYTMQIVGQKYTDPTIAALILSTEAIFSVIFGALFLGEMMSARELAGSAIIFAAVIAGQIEIKSGER